MQLGSLELVWLISAQIDYLVSVTVIDQFMIPYVGVQGEFHLILDPVHGVQNHDLSFLK